MAETAVHGDIHRGSSGDRPNRAEGNPPLSPSSSGDLISALPEAVIHHIFSFLSIVDVVRTSVLSRRWRSIWTSITDLVFDKRKIDDQLRRTVFLLSDIDCVLSQCTTPTVKRFHFIGFDYEEDDAWPEVDDWPKVHRWVEFAEEHRVEDLGLRLIGRPGGLRYKPPQLLYCLSGLVRLEVSACCFSLYGTTRIWWPCLKVLSIEDVELSDDILGRILRGSPVLESLELRRCWGMKNIVIDSPSVKDLLLMGGSFIELEKISAPHLLSLHVSGTWYPLRGPEDISLNVSSLVEAKLDFAIVTVRPGERTMCCDLLKQLLDKLHGVPTITIGSWCLKILSHLKMEAVPSPLSKCQNLILHASVSPRDLPGIAYMLRSSQCLEKLVIHLPRSELKLDEELEEHFNFDGEEFLLLQKGNFECLANHLKRAEITGFGANSFRSKHLLPLIEFLLGDALVLEKLVIEAKLPTPGVLSKLQKNVLSFRKASQNAKVIFD